MTHAVVTMLIVLVFVGGPIVLLGALIALPSMIITLLARRRYVAALQAVGACVAIYLLCGLSFGWEIDSDEMGLAMLVVVILMPIAMVVATYKVMQTTSARPLARSQG